MSAGDSCLEVIEEDQPVRREEGAHCLVRREEGAPVPIHCRRMELLGFTWHGRYYFCVHQVSIELWRLHDTPRVSVQKKIIDLGIRLLNCTREQILWLRKAGVIQNFRATMISMSDTERLYDALEQSRRKRGLLKHALKAQSLPTQRFMRAEEQRARKLKFHPFSDCVAPCGENGALIGELPSDDFVGLPAPCPLLVAGRAETVPGMYNQWEHCIEHRIGADAESQSATAGFPGGSRANVIHTSVTDTAKKAELCEHTNSVLSDSDCSDVFIVDDSEKDSTERIRLQPQPIVRAKTQSREHSTVFPPKRTAAVFRKGPLTKLCHFALQGSPRWRAEQKKGEQKGAQARSSEHPPTLHVSIPLSKLKANPKWTKIPPFSAHRMPEKPRHTALCSFATMKRAVNCWPTTTTTTHSSTSSSTSSDCSQGSDPLQGPPSGSVSVAEAKTHTTSEAHSPLIVTVRGYDSAKNSKPAQESEVVISTTAGLGGGGGDGGDCEEDDMASAASCLSPSPVAVCRKRGSKGKSRQPRAGSSAVPTKSTFSFEDLFGFYPPKLVVRNGQLEPAYSLSVKNSDHSVLPLSHPILKWTLGRPVRGSVAPKKPRKTVAN